MFDFLRNRKYSILAAIIIISIIIVIIAISRYAMNNNSIDSLDSIRVWVQIASYAAVALTIIFGGFQIFLETKINKLQREHIGSLQKTLTASTIRIGELDSTNNSLKIELEKRKRENLLIRKSISDRQIDVENFSHDIGKYAGTNMVINSISDQGETQNLSFQLIAAFEKAGWNLKDNTSGISLGGKPLIGIYISVNATSVESSKRLKFVSDEIIRQLKKYDIDLDFTPNRNNFNNDTIIIDIGRKKNPYTSNR
jgi:hypothetical protein